MASQRSSDFATPRNAFIGGAKEALGVPAMVLGATYVGFGSLARGSDFSLLMALVSTATGWALPGQIAVVEMHSIGASVLAITVAVFLINARLLPMVVTLLPIVRRPGVAKWKYYLAVHFVAVTGWIAAMKRCPDMGRENRLPYFVGFACVLWVMSMVGSTVGYYFYESLPRPVSLGLVFLNPLYFMLLLTIDLRVRPRVMAMIIGAILGPLFHLLTPDWGLLLTGLVAGTSAILLEKMVVRHG